MRRKVKGAILLVIGFYFFFGDIIITLLLPFHPYIPNIPNRYGLEPRPLDPITYLKLGLMQQGWSTIIVETIGLLLITFGSRYYVIKNKMELDPKLNEI